MTLARWKYRAGLLGLLMVLGMSGIAVCAGLVSPHDPYEQDVTARLKPPVWMDGEAARTSWERIRSVAIS